MSMKMTRESFDRLIAENIVWLVENSPDCLERNHILSVLGCASESHYGKQSEIDRLTRELAEAKARALPSMSDVLDKYEARTKALPCQHEIPERGCSTYNWQMAVIRDLRAMLSARPELPPNGLPSKESGR